MGRLKYEMARFRFYLKKFIKKEAYIENKEVDKIVREIEENGFAVVENFYTPEECKSLREEVDSLILKRREEGRLWSDKECADERCYVADEDNELIREYFSNSFLNSVADNYFKAKMICSHTLAARIRYAKGNVGSGGGWHRDGNHMQFKAIVYLSNVEMKDGPFQVIKGSHQHKNILKHLKLTNNDGVNLRFSNEELETIKKEEPDNYTLLTAKEGTLLFADTSTLHTGLPLSEGGERYTLFNYYYPSYDNIEARRERFKNVHKQSSEYD